MAKEMDIQSISSEEFLSELQSRQIKGGKKTVGPLSTFSDMEIFEKMIETQKVIYGVDDRKEIMDVVDQVIRNNADSVVAIFNFDQLLSNGDGTATLSVRSYKEAQRLCSNEPFAEQPVGPHCTGFLIAPDVIATAGHCIEGSNFLMKRFVFGFEMLDKENARLQIPENDIYQAIAIIDRRLEGSGSDYAIVKLDRPVTGHKAVKLNSRKKIRDNEKLYVIGHPSGLPKKFADGANVRDNTAGTHFVSNLDTYGGNSGSPVFNAITHEVEGILVRGENDFVIVNGCARSQVCPSTGCRGEDVTRVSEFFNKIPKESSGENSLEERVANLELSVTSFKDDFTEIKKLLQAKTTQKSTKKKLP